MHLVFLNTKYPDVGTAATEADGLTVIGVFLEKVLEKEIQDEVNDY